jgi:hypothetical protein
MERAARESGCGVPWQLLAAIARVESNFGRNMATSSAGALGYGQFLPSSWQAFGSEGNVYDYRDALPAMALYLCQAGLARDPRAALFAYNHADWYVDMVLDLAVRYDRIAPGSPIPEVLGVGPPADAGPPIHYAPGRDVGLQSRVRHADAGTTWIGVPWHGRTPGAPISPLSIEDTTLEMLRGAFGLSGRPPSSSTADAQGFADLGDRAWAAGLLPLTADSGTWTLEAIRAHLEHSQPVVALLDSKGLPGHPPTEATGDQPVVVIGTTADGLIVSDPTFSSSLGYGLQLSDAEFLASWQSASSPRRALAFALRPKPLARQAHLRTAEPPEPFARVVPTPTPVPTPSPTAPVVPALPPAAPDILAAPPVPAESALPAAAAVTTDRPRVEYSAGLSRILLACASVFAAAAVAVAVAVVFRQRRARRWDGPTGRAATEPRRSGQ